MGLANAELICHKLQYHGMPAETPVALIERGTTPHQRHVVATLGNLVEVIEREGFRPPTLIVVGEVVRLADTLAPGMTTMSRAESEERVAAPELRKVAR